MKKKCYGLYVLFLGLQLKTFRKKDVSFQMKFVQAATKYLSMVLIITAFAIACTTPGGGIPIISEDEPEEVKGNWKAGLIAETIEEAVISSEINTTEKENSSDQENTYTEITIINNSFEEPMSPGVTLLEGDQLSGWSINKGNIHIVGNIPSWIPHPNGIQSLSLNGTVSGGIYQEIQTIENAKYLLTFKAKADMACGPEIKKFSIHFNNEERMTLESDKEKWNVYEVTLESKIEDNKLGFESENESECGIGIDEIQLFMENNEELTSQNETVTVAVSYTHLTLPTNREV